MAGKGITWERVCNNSREKLRQEGCLSWFRMHPPVLRVGPGRRNKRGSFLAVRTGFGPPDWVALTNAIALLGDDKNCKGSRWDPRNVKKHQAEAFDDFQSQGGIAVVLLRMDSKSRWVLPWSWLKPYWDTKKSITTELLENKINGLQWRFKSEGNPAYDWLTPLLEWMGTLEK